MTTQPEPEPVQMSTLPPLEPPTRHPGEPGESFGYRVFMYLLELPRTGYERVTIEDLEIAFSASNRIVAGELHQNAREIIRKIRWRILAEWIPAHQDAARQAAAPAAGQDDTNGPTPEYAPLQPGPHTQPPNGQGAEIDTAAPSPFDIRVQRVRARDLEIAF